MLKEEFTEVLGSTLDLTDDYMAQKIVTEVMSHTKMKKFITMNVWVETFSLFLRGTLEEKIKFCFGVYDDSKKGYLGRDVLYK